MKKILIFIVNIPKYIALFLISIFKFCISPFIPHACKFSPTCSVYASSCFAQWGFFVGLKLTISRIFRCNFQSAGGNDPVPLNPKRKFKYFM